MVASSNIAEFVDAVNLATKDLTETQVVQTQKTLALEAFGRITFRMPVDEGFARGNTRLEIGVGSDATRKRKRKGPVLYQSRKAFGTTDASARVASETLAVLARLRPFSVITIGNNADYLEFDEDPTAGLEHGSSKQAPLGMFAITFEELRDWAFTQ